MIKQTISYTDVDGRVCTEDFYFNLTKAELLEMQVSRVGGFADSMKYLVESKDQKGLLAVIKEMVLTAYGERSDVSRHFVKKPEYAEAFSHTEAFSTLFMSLFEDSAKAAKFFEGLMPADMMAEVKAEEAARAGRPATQDHQQKATRPTDDGFQIVKAEEGVEIQQPIDHHAKTSIASFGAMSPEDQARFIREGGEIDPSL